jgi:Rrf2 family cysteine metabolism transcriptional repressor
MKLSTKGRYGTRAMLDIALHQNEGPVPLKDIAQRQRVSLSYLEHIIAPLSSAGLIHSTRGPRGGVTLVKPAEEIKIGDVIQVLEGSVAPVDCVDNPSCCDRSGLCVTREVWTEMKNAIDGVLGATTLKDLIERQRKKEQPMYYI